MDSLGCLVAGCDLPNVIEEKEREQMLIYPNPAQNKITINLQGLQNLSGLNLSIFNIQGQLLLQQPLHQNNTEIDISKLQQGVYFAKINFSDGSFARKKFVIMK